MKTNNTGYKTCPKRIKKKAGTTKFYTVPLDENYKDSEFYPKD